MEAGGGRQGGAGGAKPGNGSGEGKEAFSREDVRGYLEKNIELLREAAERVGDSQPPVAALLGNVANSLSGAMMLLEAPKQVDLEDLERRLTILDEKMHASLLSHASEELILKIRREDDSQFAGDRGEIKVYPQSTDRTHNLY